MRIQNYTKIPTPLLREMIRFCCPSGVSGFDIAFKNSQHFRGRAYTFGCHYHTASRGRGASGKSWYIVIGCPAYRRYAQPHVTDYGRGYLRSVQFSYEEDVVHLIAHELRHLWQRKVKRGYRVWGARGQYSERDADAYAIHKVREWRRR